MSKILILGSTGMLGNAVGKYFEQTNHNVTLTYRNESVAYGTRKYYFDPLGTYNQGNPFGRLDQEIFVKGPFDYIINCIGTIKPFMASNPKAARYLNSVFPWELAEWSERRHSKLIHITTDCVFSGKKGSSYHEDDLHDCLDDYGKSKSLGEPVSECMVIRTSIIGEEIHKNASLIEWAKSQKGKDVKGFTNHLWNGITTKQYAKVCHQIIEGGLWEKGLKHVHSADTVNKLQMLEIFNEKFDLDLKIQEFQTPEPCDRSLSSKFGLTSVLNVPTVKEQVMDL